MKLRSTCLARIFFIKTQLLYGGIQKIVLLFSPYHFVAYLKQVQKLEFEEKGGFAEEYTRDGFKIYPLFIVCGCLQGQFFFFEVIGVDDHEPYKESFLVFVPSLGFSGKLFGVVVAKLCETIPVA